MIPPQPVEDDEVYRRQLENYEGVNQVAYPTWRAYEEANPNPQRRVLTRELLDQWVVRQANAPDVPDRPYYLPATYRLNADVINTMVDNVLARNPLMELLHPTVTACAVCGMDGLRLHSGMDLQRTKVIRMCKACMIGLNQEEDEARREQST